MNWGFGQLILISLSPNALIQVSKNSVMSVSSSPHSTMSSANIIYLGTYILSHILCQQIHQEKERAWAYGRALVQSDLHPGQCCFASRYLSRISLMHLSGTFRSLEHLLSVYAVERFFIVCNVILSLSAFLNCMFQYENFICRAPT